MKSSKGFTLIELLVAISIIAILTVVLLANFMGPRARGRDGLRKSHLSQIQTALEIYRSNHGVYPPTSAFQTCGENVKLQSPDTSTVYIQKIPCDPNGGVYFYTNNSETYTLIACLENTQDQSKDSVFNTTCGGIRPASFTVTNP